MVGIDNSTICQIFVSNFYLVRKIRNVHLYNHYYFSSSRHAHSWFLSQFYYINPIILLYGWITLGYLINSQSNETARISREISASSQV